MSLCMNNVHALASEVMMTAHSSKIRDLALCRKEEDMSICSMYG